MRRLRSSPLLALLLLTGMALPALAQEKKPDPIEEAKAAAQDAKVKADTGWMLASSALVMFMVPGLALFYCGMVKRKNVLATMMQSMVALAVIGVFWIAVGYSLAFGDSIEGYLGWSWKLFFLKDVKTDDILANTNIPVYTHVMFQGMFAIITPALISGALAERIRFGPYCLFLLLWVTLVYCPLAHWVWAMNWWAEADAGTKMVGWLGAPADPKAAVQGLGALDFAGGTVVHIAAGFSGLAAILVLRKRLGYPEHASKPNSMVLTVLGAGLLWFGWFGFNGGSAVASGTLASSAFSATQAAAAAAGLTWMLAEWVHRGKPTALGLASGIVAGLVAVTPASGYVYIWGGLVIGAIAGVVCYLAVCLKPRFGYDDSLDAFGVHGIGGFLGAVLTGVFCYAAVNSAGAEGLIAKLNTPEATEPWAQVIAQFKAACVSALYTFVVSLVLVKVIDSLFGFATSPRAETEGLDQTEHGEVGIDMGPTDVTTVVSEFEPRTAHIPPNGGKRFSVTIDGVEPGALAEAWSNLCQPGAPPSPEFKAIYPHFTTLHGNRFRFRGGDPHIMRDNLERLLRSRVRVAPSTPVKAHVET